jgi:hypothetical protein
MQAERPSRHASQDREHAACNTGLLDTPYGGIEMRDAARKKLAELGVEDEPCFTRREKAREKPEYSVPDGRLTRVLYDHFKYGNSRNNAEQFRIYYAWDLELQKLIIGKMPSHLPNDQS